jgi:3-methyladenine DNA glycosylase AlkD
VKAEELLREHADPAVAAHAARYFRAEPGGYGEGDRFLGVRVPAIRKVARQLRDLDADAIDGLLASPWHEVRLLALIVMARRYARADDAERRALYELYLRRTDRVNGWDLVDTSAPHIVGRHLLTRSRKPLDRLVRSKSLWERRIAILATHYFIRNGELTDTFRLAERLLHDEHDLIHKAVGWMLREAGQRDAQALYAFLDAHASEMPRTMLRYALEKVPAGGGLAT